MVLGTVQSVQLSDLPDVLYDSLGIGMQEPPPPMFGLLPSYVTMPASREQGAGSRSGSHSSASRGNRSQ